MRSRKTPSAVLSFFAGLGVSALMIGANAFAQTADTPCTAPTTSTDTASATTTSTDTTSPSPEQTTTSTPTSTSADAPPTTPPPVVNPVEPPNVILNEVFPNPIGDDAAVEFIELRNLGTADADITGWTITDPHGRTFTANITIAANGYAALSYADTKIPLVNTGDTLTLNDAAGKTADTVTYDAAKEGSAYAKHDDGTWEWTSTPTSDAENIFDAPLPTPPAASPVEPPAAPATTADSASTPEPIITPPPPVSQVEPPAPIDVIISEFMPNPAGDSQAEWIELFNRGAADAALGGWQLDDDEGGSSPYPFKNETVPAGGWIVMPKSVTKLALNNDGDAVRLIDPSGAIHEVVRYKNAPSGKSLARFDDAWQWTSTPTPGSANVAGTNAGAVATTVAAATSPTGTPPGSAVIEEGETPLAIDLGSLDQIEDDALVRARGVVSLPPGAIGSSLFAITDGNGGIFVRALDLAGSALAVGDDVAIIGRLRRRGDRTWIATNGAGIEKIGRTAVAYDKRDLGDIGADDEGAAVELSGTVSKHGKRWIALADDGDADTVRAAFARNAAMPAVENGTTATVRGVVRIRGGDPEIVIAADRDLAVAANPKPAADAQKTAALPSLIAPIAAATRAPLFLAAADAVPLKIALPTAAVLLAGAAGTIIWRRKRYAEMLDG